MGVNVTADGNLTKDVDLRYGKDGKPWARFSIASNEYYGQGEDRREFTTYVDCKVFGPMAENLANSAHKGDRVFVVGKWKNEKWNDASGEERRTTVLQADDIAISLKWATARVERSQGSSRGSGGYSQPVSQNDGPSSPFEDDSPFG